MGKALRELEFIPDNDIEIGKYYAYEKDGKLHIGKAVKNPAKHSVYPWAMKNLNTGKIEYPYYRQIVTPESTCSEVILCYRRRNEE